MVPTFVVLTLYAPFPAGMTCSLSFRERASGKIESRTSDTRTPLWQLSSGGELEGWAKGPLNAVQRQNSRSLL